MTQILLYSDEPMLTKGFESVLRNEDGFEMMPSCSTVAAMAEVVARQVPDLLILDLTPEITYAVLSDLRRALPETSMVLWVNNISTDMAFQAMGLGVRGILRKTLPVELQVKCLHKVRDGELWFEKSLTDSFLGARRVTLSRRESQLVSLLAQGLKNKDIATILMISEGSVKVYLTRLFQKVGVKDRFELALFGLKNLTTAGGEGDRRQAAGAGLRSLLLDKTGGKVAVPVPPLPVTT